VVVFSNRLALRDRTDDDLKVEVFLGSLGFEHIRVVAIYEIDGNGEGIRGRTLGYFPNMRSAKKAGEALGHGLWRLEEDIPALRLKEHEYDSGKVFILRTPVAFTVAVVPMPPTDSRYEYVPSPSEVRS